MRTLAGALCFTVAILAFASACPGEDAKTAKFFAELDRDANGLLEARELNASQKKIVAGYARHLGVPAKSPFPLAALKKMWGNSEAPPTPRFDVRSTRFGPSAKRPVPGFGTNSKRDGVPGFGTQATRSRSKVALVDEDLHQARDQLLRFDRNQNGLLERRELADVDWTKTPLTLDTSRDGRLDFGELAAGRARQRLAEAVTARRAEINRAAVKKRPQPQPALTAGSPSAKRRTPRPRGGSPSRTPSYLAASVMSRYDANRDGELTRVEWSAAGENIRLADVDRDSKISQSELTRWVAVQLAKKNVARSQVILPEWFVALDRNRDRQVSMSEYSQQWTVDKVRQFMQYDANDDGIISSSECLAQLGETRNDYRNDNATVIAQRSAVESAIEIEDDFLIDDIDVQLSITHTHVSQLDVYLVGPGGDRIELCTAVGGKGDHFEKTIFDDEAPKSIAAARPPFRGRFAPESATGAARAVRRSREPALRGLTTFYGKRSVGRWQLIVRASRSDRPGILHGWRLTLTCREQGTQGSVPAATGGSR